MAVATQPFFCADCDGELRPGEGIRQPDGRWVCPSCKRAAKDAASEKDQGRLFEEQRTLFNPATGRRVNVEGYTDATGFHPIRASKDYNEFLAGDFEPRERYTEAQRQALDREYAALEAEIKADTLPPKTLAQFVRSIGGMTPGGMFAGEVKRLSFKETGTTGLINKNARQGRQKQTPEYVMDYANEEGYRDKNGRPYSNIGDFLIAVEKSAVEGIDKHRRKGKTRKERDAAIMRKATAHNPSDKPLQLNGYQVRYAYRVLQGSEMPSSMSYQAAANYLLKTFGRDVLVKTAKLADQEWKRKYGKRKRNPRRKSEKDAFGVSHPVDNPAKVYALRWQTTQQFSPDRFARKADAIKAGKQKVDNRWLNSPAGQRDILQLFELTPGKQHYLRPIGPSKAVTNYLEGKGPHPNPELFGADAKAGAKRVAKIRPVIEKGTGARGEIIGSAPGGFVKVKWLNRSKPSLIKPSQLKRGNLFEHIGYKLNPDKDALRQKSRKQLLAERRKLSGALARYSGDDKTWKLIQKEIDAIDDVLASHLTWFNLPPGAKRKNPQADVNFWVKAVRQLFPIKDSERSGIASFLLERVSPAEAKAVMIKLGLAWPRDIVIENPKPSRAKVIAMTKGSLKGLGTVRAYGVNIAEPSQKRIGRLKGYLKRARTPTVKPKGKLPNPLSRKDWDYLVREYGTDKAYRALQYWNEHSPGFRKAVKGVQFLKDNEYLWNTPYYDQSIKPGRTNPESSPYENAVNIIEKEIRRVIREDKRHGTVGSSRASIKQQIRPRGLTIPPGYPYNQAFNEAFDRVEKTLKGYRLYNPSVKALAEKFQGKASGAVTELKAANSAPRDLARIGKLVFLKVVGVGQVRTPGMMLAADTRERLWITGTRAPLFTPRAQPGTMKDFGEVAEICYLTAKTHIGDGKTFEYVHKFGEDGGKRPHLLVDAEGMPVLRGGDYRIKAEGIVN